ncbi:AraC-type DNA-binding protein [Pedobacter steynii]|uniref:AraC-type DNA-binding protein n=1 Tax=Pedobacter steynii TaxID=430522 RepID=A0A1G9JF08_9SPHI|nr:AraC family transcriptional regulator [Pedobacter steynii]NQX38223.1 helix-turn-helix transcriptional regulator [Pedobacter steynii]SDL35796.1 AraC-type DNA-binding protein [Pedobacter steynii]
MSIAIFDIEKGYTLFSRSNYLTKRHAHYAIEIVCSINGLFELSTQQGNYTNLQNVIIPPNLTHSFNSLNSSCNLLFLDPLSHIGHYFMQQYQLAGSKNVLTNVPEVRQLHQEGNFDMPQISHLGKSTSSQDIDPRITGCIQAIDKAFADQKISLNELAALSFLSKDRLAHLFKAQLGISVHQYILWKKILLAVSNSREGHSLTTCAHSAGFTDSSHFHRAFYKMFGTGPSFVLKS